TPVVAHETILASGLMPRFLASSAVISTSAAAPSLMPEALPAVTEPPSLAKAGRSLASVSTVVTWRGNASVSTTTLPLLVFIVSADHHDRSVAVADRLPAERDGAQARATELVDTERGLLDGDTGIHRRLARRVLALTGTEDLAHDDFVDLLGLDLGALERTLDRDLAKI